MRQPAMIVATLTGSLLFGVSIAGALRAPAPGAPAAGTLHVVATNADAPRSIRDDAEPTASLQSAALADAIRQAFPGHAVDVALDVPTRAVVDPGSVQEEVHALARVRIDGSAPMPVRAVALYDREARSILAPSLSFEGAASPQPVDAPMRDALAAATARRLGAEFAGQAFGFQLADVESARVGGRYLRVLARGTADFGAEGRAATTVEALYDPRNGEWLRLDYALGADPADAPVDGDYAYAGS